MTVYFISYGHGEFRPRCFIIFLLGDIVVLDCYCTRPETCWKTKENCFASRQNFQVEKLFLVHQSAPRHFIQSQSYPEVGVLICPPTRHHLRKAVSNSDQTGVHRTLWALVLH